MASKRILKKKVRSMVFEILNDCDYVVVSGGKNADKADALIDEAVDFHDGIIAKINKATSKKEYNDIHEELKKGSLEFTKKLNSLNK
jgi:hypothetical protein